MIWKTLLRLIGKNRIASDFLRMNVIKIMLDGSLGGRTALLKKNLCGLSEGIGYTDSFPRKTE